MLINTASQKWSSSHMQRNWLCKPKGWGICRELCLHTVKITGTRLCWKIPHCTRDSNHTLILVDVQHWVKNMHFIQSAEQPEDTLLVQMMRNEPGVLYLYVSNAPPLVQRQSLESRKASRHYRRAYILCIFVFFKNISWHMLLYV